jgi:acetylornithine aminotransferase
MQGLVLREEADPVGPVVARARDLGLLLVGAGPRVVRFVPPLTVDEGEIDEAVSIVGEALA